MSSWAQKRGGFLQARHKGCSRPTACSSAVPLFFFCSPDAVCEGRPALLQGASQSSPCSHTKVEGGQELCKDRAGLVWGLVFGSWGHFQPLVQLLVCNRLITVPCMSCLWGVFLREEKNDGIQGGKRDNAALLTKDMFSCHHHGSIYSSGKENNQVSQLALLPASFV